MKKTFRNTVITLVAVVITTIILLILAGITISTIVGGNGLTDKTKLAQGDTVNIEFNYEIKRVNNKDGKIIYNILVIVQSNEKITKLEYGEQLLKTETGEEKIAIDFEAQKDIEYKFKITTLNGNESEKTLVINYIPINLDKNEIFIGKTEKNTLIATIDSAFSDLASNDFIWQSLDENIAKVSESGEVEGIDIGQTTIIAKLKDGNGEAKCIVNVCNKLDLEELVDNAQDGDTIEIPEGTYLIDPISSTLGYTYGFSQSGIHDKGKQLTFIGKNEKTKLIYKGNSSTGRDGNAIQLLNSNSIVRNLIYEFYPDKSTYNGISNSIITHSKGKIYNVYFKIHNDNPTMYTYTNHSYLDISMSNCTFYFKNTNLIENCYGGGSIARYENILTNYEPVYATEKTNILSKSFNSLEVTKNDEGVINKQVGVYFGEYAWKF